MIRAEEELAIREMVAIEVARFVSPRNLFIVGMVVLALSFLSLATTYNTWSKVSVHDVYITNLKADVAALETMTRFADALEELNRNVEAIAASSAAAGGEEGTPLGDAAQ